MKLEEIRDIGISTAALGLAFTVLFFGNGDPGFIISSDFVPALVAATALAAVSFLPHVFSHRVSSRAIKAHGEYRMWKPGILIAVLSPFVGPFVFAATGGMEMFTRKGERYGHWEPHLDVDQVGLVTVLGPLMSVMIAVIFAFMSDAFTVAVQGQNLLSLGVRMNAFIAISSMLPFYPLDGYKILRWETPIWIFVMVLALLLFLL